MGGGISVDLSQKGGATQKRRGFTGLDCYAVRCSLFAVIHIHYLVGPTYRVIG